MCTYLPTLRFVSLFESALTCELPARNHYLYTRLKIKTKPAAMKPQRCENRSNAYGYIQVTFQWRRRQAKSGG